MLIIKIMITVIAIASGLYMRYFIIEAIKGVQSKNWPQAHGTIIKSLVAERSGGDLESYAPEISYDFEVLGEKYLGSNLAFLNNYSSNSIENVEELISEYPIGRRVTIYYNPEEPSVRVLISGIYPNSASMSLGVISAIFIVAWPFVMFL